MDRFVSNTTLRLDAKGRVSIPASFRSLLTRDGFAALYGYPALDQPAIEAGGTALLAEIDTLVNRFAPYSGEREDVLMALYGRSETMTMDTEGRVVLPQELKSYAGITDAVVFVGLGHKFQIWEPQRFRAHLAKATATARTLSKGFAPERPAADEAARE